MMAPGATTSFPFGVLSHQTKDQVYLLQRGLIFTSPWVANESTRISASILLTAKGDPFELTVDERTDTFQAVAVKPLITRRLRAENVAFVSVCVTPNHRLFRRFRGIGASGLAALPRDAFRRFDRLLELAYQGHLSIEDAAQLFDDFVSVAAQHLPKSGRTDPRIERAIELLDIHPSQPLQELAQAIGLSYDRMSHLFADNVGISLRSYQLWQKLRIVGSLIGSGRSLTDIALAAGFTDSAHLSNAWQKCYGAPPSYFLYSDTVELRSQCQSAQPSATSNRSRYVQRPRIETTVAQTKEPCFCQSCGALLPPAAVTPSRATPNVADIAPRTVSQPETVA